MHPYFTNQKINYAVYLIEPVGNITFNRGLIMNIGFLEAIKDEKNIGDNFKWNCFIFHDVDMIPEDIRVIYKCDEKAPTHFAVSVSKWNYQ